MPLFGIAVPTQAYMTGYVSFAEGCIIYLLDARLDNLFDGLLY
jgi:hypothetical protein